MITISPLRYPGGKTRFSKLIANAIKHSGEKASLFIEPLCGGSGVSIALLESKEVEQVALNDVDPLVSSFWQVVFGKSTIDSRDVNWLISRIESVNHSVHTWKKIKASRPASLREAAFKCLYLNRTSFNGILHKSGPIGGWGQENRTLDVRFNREKLIRRIKSLYEMRHQVVRVGCESWRQFCASTGKRSGAYIYLDPPYYHKAEQLYGHRFSHKDHVAMRDYLRNLDIPWMLSYDDAPQVRELYGHLSDIYGCVVDQTYSAHPIGGASFVGRELFFSNRELPVAHRRREHRGISVVGPIRSVAMPTGPVRTPFLESAT